MAQAPRRGINAHLLAADPPVLRPRDATWWRNPAKELASLAEQGVVVAAAHGHYVVVPPARVGDATWRPTLEGFALALAQRTAGSVDVALMGISAARVHAALPRAVGVATVTAQRQHRPMATAWGTVWFVMRDIDKLAVQRAQTDLAEGWVTTAEQTLLDVADRPELGDLDPDTASEVIVSLATRSDWDQVADLAAQQRRRAAFARARWVADAVLDPGTPKPRVPSSRRYAPALGLRPARPTPSELFGVIEEA